MKRRLRVSFPGVVPSFFPLVSGALTYSRELSCGRSNRLYDPQIAAPCSGSRTMTRSFCILTIRSDRAGHGEVSLSDAFNETWYDCAVLSNESSFRYHGSVNAQNDLREIAGAEEFLICTLLLGTLILSIRSNRIRS